MELLKGCRKEEGTEERKDAVLFKLASTPGRSTWDFKIATKGTELSETHSKVRSCAAGGVAACLGSRCCLGFLEDKCVSGNVLAGLPSAAQNQNGAHNHDNEKPKPGEHLKG